MSTKIWSCKIGETASIPRGADLPMRRAVASAYKEITGSEPDFIFSGWGAQLTESERAVVEDRLPDAYVMTYTCEDGPQETAAAAYQHGADLAAAIAEKARRQSPPDMPVYVRVERVEHLAAGLAARAEEAVQ